MKIRIFVAKKLSYFFAFAILLGLSFPVTALRDRASRGDANLTLVQTAEVIDGSIVDTLYSTGLVFTNDFIQYQLDYQNTGTTGTYDFVISGSIAPGTCYIIGSLETNSISGYTISYSNSSSGLNRTYSPVGLSGSVDCNVTYYKIEKPFLAGADIIDREFITTGTLSNTSLSASGAVLHADLKYSKVQASPYDPILTTSANWGGSNIDGREFLTLGNRYRIRQNGTIKKMRLYVDNVENLTGFYLKVRRYTGGTYDLVGTSENLISQFVTGTISSIILNSPISGVQEGDYYGYTMIWNAGGGSHNLTAKTTNIGNNGESRYTTNLLYTGAQTWATGGSVGSLPGELLPIELYMDRTDIVFIGDSIIAGHPAHYAFVEGNNITDLDSTIPYFLSTLTGNYSYQNMGIGGQRVAWIAERFQAQVLDLNPKMVLIEGGVNDIASNVVTEEQFLSGWRYMLDLAQANMNVQKILVLKILPWTEGTTGWNTTRDQWNESLVALASGYSKAIVIDAAPYVGVDRAGVYSGNLWDINPLYNPGDDVHFNSTGHQKIAQAISDALSANNVVVANGFTGTYQLLFTGTNSIVQRKNLFVSDQTPSNTAIRYSVRGIENTDCTTGGTTFIDGAIATGNQISLAQISGATNRNICVTAYLSTTDESTTPVLSGLLAMYLDEPLSLTYRASALDIGRSLDSNVIAYSASGLLVTSNYSFRPITLPAVTFGGGGGGSAYGRPLDNCQWGDRSGSDRDRRCDPAIIISGENVNENGQQIEEIDEMEYSFAWAHARGITTLFPQKDARLYDPITREELAKMISQYLINVQHRELVLSEDSCDDFADLSQASRDLQDDIIRVCQLGIMGVTAGKSIPLFRPQDDVTRVEFGTILSRIIWGDKYEQPGELWYQGHLDALKSHHIMNSTGAPFALELRGWILLMLWRQSLTNK